MEEIQNTKPIEESSKATITIGDDEIEHPNDPEKPGKAVYTEWDWS